MCHKILYCYILMTIKRCLKFLCIKIKKTLYMRFLLCYHCGINNVFIVNNDFFEGGSTKDETAKNSGRCFYNDIVLSYRYTSLRISPGHDDDNY